MTPRTKPQTRRRQNFLPRLEALEDRRVPALIITPPTALAKSQLPLPPGVVAPTATGGVVLIDNRSASSSSTTNVTITDNGFGKLTISSNTVSTVDLGAGDQTITRANPTVTTAPGIHLLEYLASPGTDNFVYKMTNPAVALHETMDVEVYLPVSAPPLPLKGNKAFNATFGQLATPFVPASAGTGAKAGVKAAHVDVAGHLTIHIHGTQAADNASLAYAGKVTHRLDVIYDEFFPAGSMANEDGDKITYSVQATQGSTGLIVPKMTGGPGPDVLTLLVQKRVASDRARIRGAHAVNGGGSGVGLNNCVIGGAITAINC